MKRLVLGSIAIASAAASLLLVAQWARSYLVGDVFRREGFNHYVEIGSAQGRMVIRFTDRARGREPHWEHIHWDEPYELLNSAGLADTFWNHLGFGMHSRPIGPGSRGSITSLMVPFPLVLVIASLSAVMWVWHWLQRPRPVPLKFSWCPVCWREIEGQVSVCPECGGQMAVEDDWHEALA